MEHESDKIIKQQAMNLNPEVTNYINNASIEQIELLEVLRQLIHESVSNISEAIKWGFPVFSNKKDFTYFRFSKKHITLGFYNFEKRKAKNRSTENNSGNFVSFRFLTRGNTIESNFIRSSNFDFAFGPTWGIQRKYGKNFHLLFDIGPHYYFDTNGNGGFFPIMFQLNLGFNLKKE